MEARGKELTLQSCLTQILRAIHMKSVAPTILLSVCLLFFFPVLAEKARLECPSGQFWLSPSGGCVPCQNCGDQRLLQPCSPMHDTVCGDSHNVVSFHIPCKGSLGVHVDFKRARFLNLTKQQKAKTTKRTCGILQKHQRKIFGQFRPQEYRCGNGSYQWKESFSSGSSGGPVICRPCSQCLHGRRVMFPCQGSRDTLCAFDPVNNTAELFSTACSARETIRVYSSKVPTLSQWGIRNIKLKLETPLCMSMPVENLFLNVTWDYPAVSARQDKAERVPHRRATRAISTHVGQPSNKRRIKRTWTKKCRKSKRMWRKCLRSSRLRRKWHKRCAKLKRRYRSLCRRRNCKGKHCKEVQGISQLPHQNTNRTDHSGRKGKTGSVASTTVAPTPHPSTQYLSVSVATTRDPKAAQHATVSSPRAATTLTSGVLLGNGDLYLAEDEDRKNDVDSAHVIAIVTSVIVALALCVIVFLLVYCRRRTSWKCIQRATRLPVGYFTEIADIDQETTCHPFPAVKPHWENTDPVLRIVDPLRRGKRLDCRDSGYSSTRSAHSSRGSSCLCKEVPSTQTVLLSSFVSAARQQRCPNVLLADGFEDTPLSAAGGSLPAFPGVEEEHGHSLMMIPRGRRAQSLSEDDSLLDRKFRLRSQILSRGRSSLQPFDSDTEAELAGDGEITESHESVFNFLDRLCGAEGCETSVSLSSGAGDDVPPACFPPAECESEVIPTTLHLNNSHPSTNTERSASLDDLSVYSPQFSKSSPKLRNPSGDSSSSSASSSVSIQLRISLNDVDTHWLHKSKDIGPENFLATYTTSAMTQTEDWSKSNLKARPIFCSTWQGCHSFSASGGIWSLPGSDIRLEVPPGAVLPGSYVDVTGATYTNLAHLRQVLKLADQQVMAGPLAEFDAGAGFRFQRNIFVYLAHCLPPGVSEDQVMLHHIDKGEDGQLIFRTLPSKTQYNTRQTHVGNEEEQRDSNGDPRAEDDIGYFEFQSNGELKIVTKRFCCFVCSICSARIPDPRIHLVVTARQILASTPSGLQRQINVYLHLWDRKITIKDFRRDYLGNSLVGEQTLHVIEDCQDSLMKLAFTIMGEEAHQQWRHLVRSKTTGPFFPATKCFPLKELMCCHAKDTPHLVEWMVVNVPGLQEPCYDFQCIIDVDNVAHPNHPHWNKDDASRQLLTQRVTLFVGDISNAATVGASIKDVPPQLEPAGKGAQNARHQPDQGFPSAVSNTPCGQMEQEPFQRLGLSNGQVDLPAGPMNLPVGPMNLPAGPMNVPAGLMNLPAGPMHVPAGPMNVPAGPMNVPAGPMNVPAGPMNVPAGPMNVPAGPMNVPAGPMNVPAGPMNLPAGPMNVPAGPMNLPAGPEDVSDGAVDVFDRLVNLLNGSPELSNTPDSDRLSEEVRLHPIPFRIRNSDPTPLSQLWSAGQAADEETDPKALERSVSYPQTAPRHTGSVHRVAEAAAKAEGQPCSGEPEQNQHGGMARQKEGDQQQFPNPPARDRFGTGAGKGEDVTAQHVQQGLRRQTNTAAATPLDGKGGTRPKVFATGALQQHTPDLKTQGGQLLQQPERSADNVIRLTPEQEAQSRYASSILVRDQTLQHALTDRLQTATDRLETATDCLETDIDATNGLQTATDCLETDIDATNDLQTATDCLETDIDATNDLQTATDCLETDIDATNDLQTATDCLETDIDATNDLQTATDCLETAIDATNDLQTATDCLETAIDATNDLQTATYCLETAIDATNGLQTAANCLEKITAATKDLQASADCLQIATDATNDLQAYEDCLQIATDATNDLQASADCLQIATDATNDLQASADCLQIATDATNGHQTSTDCLQTATDCLETVTDDTDGLQSATDCVETAIDATNGLQTATDCPETATDRPETATDCLESATDCLQTATDRLETATDRLETATDRLETATDRLETATHGHRTSTDCLQTAADSGHVTDERGQGHRPSTKKKPVAVVDSTSGAHVSCSDHSPAFFSSAYKPNLNRRPVTALADSAQNINMFFH